MEEYTLYHDESKEDAFYHSFIMVNNRYKDNIQKILLNEKLAINDGIKEVTIKKIGPKVYNNYSYRSKNTLSVVEKWSRFLISTLPTHKYDTHPLYFKTNEDKEKKYNYKSKFCVFKMEKDLNGYNSSMSKDRRIYISLKTAIKGFLHSSFKTEKIKITDIIFDGYEHYDNFELFKKDLQIELLRELNKDIVDLSNLKISMFDKKKSETYFNDGDSILLQLVDVLLGGVRYLHCMPPLLTDKKYCFFHNIFSDLIDKDTHCFPRMQNSRYLNSYRFTDCKINESFKFSKLKRNSKNQLELF